MDLEAELAFLTEEHGYAWEAPTVMTLDGWELPLIHFTGKLDEAGNVHDNRVPGKPPVLFVHAAGSDAREWLQRQEGKPAMLELVDAGYDVWMGNNRASQLAYCVEDLADSCQNDSLAFWRMGRFDAPAMVNGIRKLTGQPKVTYIGYAMGNMQMFYAISKKTESYWTERLHSFIALAPCYPGPAVAEMADIESLHVHFLAAAADKRCKPKRARGASDQIPSPNKSWHQLEEAPDHYYFEWATSDAA